MVGVIILLKLIVVCFLVETVIRIPEITNTFNEFEENRNAKTLASGIFFSLTSLIKLSLCSVAIFIK